LNYLEQELTLDLFRGGTSQEYNCTDWELAKLIDIKRQEYANNRDEVSHCQRFHQLRLAKKNEHVGSEELHLYYYHILVVLCQSISLVLAKVARTTQTCM